MPEIALNNLFVAAAVAVAVPILVGLVPRLPVPAVVLEIVGGLLVGPSVLGWLHVDAPVTVLADLGLGLLLFLVGYEIDLSGISGTVVGPVLVAYVVSGGLALAIALILWAAGLIISPLLISITLASTSLGLLGPVLRDRGHLRTPLGRVMGLAASVAEFVPILMASLFFSITSHSAAERAGLVAGFVAMVVLSAALVVLAHRRGPLTGLLDRFEETTSQLAVRLSLFLTLAFAALARSFELSAVLGAFLAGVLLCAADRRDAATLHRFGGKLDAVGYGTFVPVFFIVTGAEVNVHDLLSSAALVRIPLFLAALLVARGLPAVFYRRILGDRGALAAGTLQATNLTFIVIGTSIGLQLHNLRPINADALLAAGILSVLLFPQIGLSLLGGEEIAHAPEPTR